MEENFRGAVIVDEHSHDALSNGLTSSFTWPLRIFKSKSTESREIEEFFFYFMTSLVDD